MLTHANKQHVASGMKGSAAIPPGKHSHDELLMVDAHMQKRCPVLLLQCSNTQSAQLQL